MSNINKELFKKGDIIYSNLNSYLILEITNFGYDLQYVDPEGNLTRNIYYADSNLGCSFHNINNNYKLKLSSLLKKL